MGVVCLILPKSLDVGYVVEDVRGGGMLWEELREVLVDLALVFLVQWESEGFVGGAGDWNCYGGLQLVNVWAKVYCRALEVGDSSMRGGCVIGWWISVEGGGV